MKNAIEIKGLTKLYGKERGIQDIDLNIKEGEIFGFIGPNGAGKSTTIRTLLSLIYPTSGTATIFGKDCIKHASEIAKDIGYLPSEVFYYDNMKVKDLLKYSASFYKKDCSARTKELCEILELDPNRKIEDLSFGNRKKVGIIQGLLHSPKLIILDEPTGGLDPLMQNKFFELIKEENKKGATIFFSSHILSEVQKLCDRVGFIKDGKIIKLETIAALRENSYKKITLEADTSIDAEIFEMEGVTQLEVIETHASFIFKGNINELVAKISTLSLINLDITEPDLEEIFMHYYDKE
ncbi:ABC transporter ATP-binding protein [Bacillus massiliigorillae]|uniref:ABC transporter ATP-binding protein n=1 Tax=Bacillus massiliigorillae TaxID=1243664 RepID=UPI00039CFA3D|nr:ABC transporter ATP-binding protein [Bacillus massiliigorillae]